MTDVRGLYPGMYTIDALKAAEMGFLGDLVLLVNFDAINVIEWFVCDNCGRRGPDEEFYELRDVEQRTQEYPGYAGNYYCAKGSCL